MGENIELPILNSTITITQGELNYNQLLLQFNKLAYKAMDTYKEKYKSYTSIDDFMDHGYEDGLILINFMVREVFKNLVNQYKIYDLDQEQLWTYYCENLNCWTEYYEKIEEQYLKIINDSREVDEYRIQRRQQRGHFIGGGFGLGGAVKGMAMAGAANIASGSAHMVANGIGKIFSSGIDSVKKSKLYNDSKTLNILATGIYYSVYNIHYIVMEILNEKGMQYNVPTQEGIKKASAIYNNLKTGTISADNNIIDLVLTMIKMNPNKIEYFQYAVDIFGDQFNEIERVGEVLSLDIKNYKKQKIFNQYKQLEILDSSTNLIIGIEDIKNNIENLGLDESCVDLTKLMDRYEKLEVVERTYDGVTFDKKEDIELGKQELSQLEIIYKHEPKETIEEVDTLIKKLKDSSQTKAYTKYTIPLETKLNKMKEKKRTIQGVKYNTLEEAKSVENELPIIEKIRENSDLVSSKGIIKAIEEVKNMNLKSLASKNFISFLEKSLEYAKKEELFVDGVKYGSWEEAEKVREKIQVEQQILDGELAIIDSIIHLTPQSTIEELKQGIGSIEKLNLTNSISLKKVEKIKMRLTQLEQQKLQKQTFKEKLDKIDQNPEKKPSIFKRLFGIGS